MRYVCLLAVPAAAVIAAYAQPSFETPGGDNRPALAFSRYATLQGTVASTPSVNAVFPFENRADQPVTINSLAPSCGCLRVGVTVGEGTSPQNPPVEIAPGESGRIVTTFETTQETPGSHEYTIDLRTDEAEGRKPQTLTYRVTLPQRKVTVQPVPLLFYQAAAEELSQTVTVFDSRDKPLTVLGADCPNEQVVMDIRSLPDGRRTEVIVRVVGKLPRGTETTFVTITTDAADYEQIEVPVVLAGVRLTEVSGETSDAPDRSDSSGASASRED